VSELSERRIGYTFEAHERAMQRLVCEGSYRVACVTADTFKPRDFPPGMRMLMKRLPELIAEQASPRRRPTPGWT
jgi:acyl-CoA thioesterase FadM